MNPASVRDRHELYRRLVAVKLATRSPFWGFDQQLAWQHASGRLGGDDISPTSWWGACNYALCIVPYVAAMDLDLVPREALDITAYASAMPHWHGAFHRMTSLDDEADLEPLRFAIWKAHLASITIAVQRHARELALLPVAEQTFARGWIRMVDLFGAAALRTDLDYLSTRPASLPNRILDGNFDDLPRYERSAARRIIALGERPEWRWPIELAVWKRMMRTRSARDQLDTVMIDVFGTSLRGKLRAARRII
jgi:Leg1